HEIVIAYFSNIQHKSQSRSRINDTKRKVPLLRSMDSSKWASFADYFNTYYHNHNFDQLKDIISNHANMNNLWMELKKAVLDISKSKIPHKWIFTQDRAPKPKDLFQYYPSLTKIEKILLKFHSKRLRERLWPISEEWKHDQKVVANIVKDILYPLDPLPQFLNLSNVRDVKKTLNCIYKV
ncbi:16089_t:CDS:1, partial [Funneliformis geosporum]